MESLCGDDVQAFNDRSSIKDCCPSTSYRLHIPSGGELSAFSTVYECRILDLFARGETI
jgi:hypothetical protein